MEAQFIDNLLTRDARQASHKRDELVDHYDEVIIQLFRWSLTFINRLIIRWVFL
jgi:hypothetical protein